MVAIFHMLDNWYNQYRILYLLYFSRFKNRANSLSINELLGSEDLHHILTDEKLRRGFLTDIEDLADAGLISLQGNTETGILRVKSRGSDALNAICEAYEDYLNQQSDPKLQLQYRHISSLPDSIKRSEIYNYSKEAYGANFKQFLKKSRIFDKISQITPINPGIQNNLVHWTEEILALSRLPIGTRLKERENGQMERKSSFKYDTKTQSSNRRLEKEASIAVSGFMNGQGGILFIGVDPAGNVIGLDKDYFLVQNKNNDGFEREFRNSVEKYLKQKIADLLVSIRFPQINGMEICEAIIKPSSSPIVLYDGNSEEFYARVGNSTKLYQASAMIDYCQMRFGSH
jgi:Putative DNA-binding domain